MLWATSWWPRSTLWASTLPLAPLEVCHRPQSDTKLVIRDGRTFAVRTSSGRKDRTIGWHRHNGRGEIKHSLIGKHLEKYFWSEMRSLVGSWSRIVDCYGDLGDDGDVVCRLHHWWRDIGQTVTTHWRWHRTDSRILLTLMVLVMELVVVMMVVMVVVVLVVVFMVVMVTIVLRQICILWQSTCSMHDI